jgi:hypothetical protein
MQEHPLFQTGVAPGVQIDSSFGHVLEVENILGSRGLSLGGLRPVRSREKNSQKQDGNECEPAQTVAHLSTTIFVAVVAGGAATPDVGIIALVRVIDSRPSVATAIGACRNGIGPSRTGGIYVASEAHAACTAVIDAPPGVRKRRPQESGCVVAGRAGRCGIDDSRHGRVDGHVIWHCPAKRCGALPLSGMAIDTIDRRPSRTDVAGGAGCWHRGNMHSRQGETGGAMVKDRAQPGTRCMAQFASLGITGSNVIRYPGERCGTLPGSNVASVTGCRCERVIVVYVAGDARRRRRGNVHSGEGETGGAVVKDRPQPRGSAVARLASLRITASNVIRYAGERGGALPGRDVAPVAGGGFEQIVVAHMAGNAGCRHRRNVHPSQSKGGNAVIERHSVPAQRRVAIVTVLWQESRSGCTVHWVVGLIPILQMTARVSTSAWGSL